MKKQTVIKVLVAALLLSSILLSSLLGVSKAEYFKKLSKALDFEVKPDLMLEYYLYDSSTTTSDKNGLTPEYGVYKNAESFAQKIVIGRHAVQTLQNTAGSTNTSSVYYGKDIVYQIKIPVNETGYYTLNFASEFIKGDAPTLRDTYIEQDFYSVSYRDAVGCEVLNSENTNSYQDLSFGMPKALDLASRVFDDKVFAERAGYTADMAFQWKTLTPGRQENVKLSFKVNEDDVENGYVIWAWELTGLRGNQWFTFSCESLNVEKIMELDGSMVQRESDAPYFMIPKATVTNAQIRILGKNSPGDTTGAPTTGNKARRGSNTPGKTSYSDGRGTYVTEATENSLGLRVETLNSGVVVDGSTTWYYDNPTSFQVPLKNIKYNTTYKVTFDFSLAKQGNASPSKEDTSNKISTAAKNMWDYADYDEILNRNNKKPQHNSNATDSTNDNNNTHFFSYLHDDIASLDNNPNVQTINGVNFNATRITGAEHVTGSKKISYNYKEYNDQPLTKYGGIMDYTSVSTGYNYLNMVSSITVNDTYSIESFNSGTEYNSTDMRNHFNAIQHTEINGQVAINWLTFYNTTFSFNIPAGSGVDLNNLNWVWAIDMLEYESFYNIRVDNIRIQEVVEYSSKIEHNGVKIADTVTAVEVDANYYGQERNDPDKSVFNNFKGYNNIGQNYQARRNESGRYYAVGNIYAPIFDAKKLSPTASKNGNREDDYKIKISGWAVLKGGTLKYVFSVDGGFTWHDMTFEGTTDTSVFPEALQGIHQNTQEQSYEHNSGITHNFTFENEDALNDRFSDFTLTADLKNFKTQSDLDIIIAAVPETNSDLRCEILRIINYNPVNTYVSKLDSISSDIQSQGVIISVDNSKMSLNNGTSGTSNTATAHYYPVYEKGSFDYRFSASGLSSAKGQMAKSEKIEYSNLQTTYNGIPIKTTLTVKGAILCTQSVYAYEYSVDGGKTWNPCTYTMTGFTAGSDYTSDKTETALDKLCYKFITRSTAESNRSNYMGVGGKFNTDASAIKVDLSAYVGQTVDVIIAAKPNYTYNYLGRYSSDKRESNIYLPVAMIDNVAVYGDPTLDKGEDGRGMGTFYTQINEVRVDHFKTDMTLAYNDGDYLSQYGWNPALDLDRHSLTYMEPYHVNLSNTRFYNKTVQEVMSGGKIEIEGFTMIEGGVKQYKYSLDGGLTWTIMQTSTQKDYNNITDKDFFDDIAEKVDSTFDLANGDGGGISYRSEESAKLIAILPTLQVGAEENILIVAESNIEDNTGTGSGFLYPVLRMRLKVISPETYDVEYKTMLNVPISKGAFSYDKTEDTSGGAVTNYPNSSISLPGTYFVQGEPIILSYDYDKCSTIKTDGVSNTNVTVIVTTDTLVNNVYFDYNVDNEVDATKGDIKGSIWMTGIVKYRTLQDAKAKNFERKDTINLNGECHNLDADKNPYLSNKESYRNKLPVGTYKVWLFHNTGNVFGNYNFGANTFAHMKDYLLCEPLTFKVIDKDNPDFSITSYSVSPYKMGVNGNEPKTSYDDYNTSLTLPKTVYTQGEPIYFTVGMDYCARQVLITKSTLSNLDQTSAVQYPTATQGVTWQYAQHGVTDIGVTGKTNTLDTLNLDPGQYKIYYFMGENVQYAYRGRYFSLNNRHAAYCKMYTIFDIIILPNNGTVKNSEGKDIPINYTQTVTANYTKIDGTKATESGQFDVNGKLINSEYKYGKYINTYHLGIDFTKTITDVRPGTEITFSVTNNIPLDKLPSAWRNKISTIVLRETKKKV